MVVDRSNVDHIMRGLQSTEGVRLHNHRKKLRQRFDIIKKLGQGTYGKVQLGINKETGQEVAIKTIKKCKIETEADLVRIRREIQIMSSVRHPNIIHIYEVFENREKIVLVMEYAAGGELYDYLSQRKVLEETEARRIFRQISTAIYYCHKHKICHRDLKLENILLDEHGSAKIADFGLSNVFDGTRLLSTYCGSPLYASPEIVKGTPYQGPEVDCWSLGVLLYTLVYGAMPFDGSNFKRLVKQISQGDYFEPKKASTASPLIRDMLTVNSPDRATIEQICSHWWVNQGFNVSCLDIAEDLANQTPVRLDLLLSLAPPPENTEKIVVTDDQKVVPQEAPPRSLSVGSFMELDHNTEERVKSFVAREVPSDSISNEKTMKRKLEPVPSKSFSGARKKERTKPETEERETPSSVVETEQSAKKQESNNLVMDIDSETNKVEEKVKDQDLSAKNEVSAVEKTPEEKVKEIEKVEKPEPVTPELSTIEPEKIEKPNSESIAKDKPTRKSVKVVRKKVTEKKDSEKEKKEGLETADVKTTQPKKKKTDSPVREKEKEEESKKEVSQEKEVGKEIKRFGVTRKSKGTVKATEKEEKEKTPQPDESPTKPVERRKSKIFETAEKFMANDQKSPVQEKPKKVYIPGVKVSDFAKAFERRSSVPASVPLKSSPTKKLVIKESSPVDKKQEVKPQTVKNKLPEKQKEEDDSSHKDKIQKENKEKVQEENLKSEVTNISEEKTEGERQPTPINDEKLKKLKDSARNIISNALVEEERKKIKKQILKPPVPRTKTEDLDNRKKSLTLQLGKETATVEVHTPENTRFLFEPDNLNEATTAIENKENIEKPKEKKTAKVEITLKSNTLPRKTSKAEVRLSSPQIKKDVENFRTEVEHRVGDPSHIFSTQRSEVAFPVSAAQKPIRSMSLEPEGRMKQWPKKDSTVERIIPIHVEGSGTKEEYEARDRIKDLEKPYEGKQKHPYQRTWSLRSNSLSRQSTQDSDTESTISAKGEPIKKSPREFIIPIAVEGGGYVTPRATSLEPSESISSKRAHRPFSKKFSLWSDNGSEDESPFSTLPRHSSHDFDEPFRLHRLRSSRPAKASADRTESVSDSEEEEEDDDGFELLTAENLFSTLLSRVRSLTQRLNVEDGIRPGFPSSRLLSNHFGPSERLLSNFHQPMTRLSERSSFGRSLNRDLENGLNQWSRSDIRNSESNRSVPKENSKSNRSDSDTESISEYSSSLSSHQKKKKNTDPKNKEEVKKSKKPHYHSRTKSMPLGENDHVTEYVPTFDGNRSLYTPSRMWTTKVYEGEPSSVKYRSGIPKLQRPSSLMLERRRSSREDFSENETDSEKPREKDFYDILAEKYGITNVKRYDLTPDKRDRKGYRLEKRNSNSSEKKEENEKKQEEKISDAKEADVKEESLPEKYKGPSEKLAAVLHRLEGRNDKAVPTKKENMLIEKKINLGSPAMQELYEKTLAEYIKSKKNDQDTKKSKIPKKVSLRHKSDMTLKEFESQEQEVKQEKYLEKLTKEPKPSEKSVLGKYLRYSSQNEEENMLKKKTETDVDSAEQFKADNLLKEKDSSSPPPPKNKFLTSLEKKLEKLRSSTEKKYVDKAIRSLRENSIGPKDVSSENVLIKRAVSVSDCPAYKSSQPGAKVQSTVNSVLGMFKKFETENDKKENVENKETSKIPAVKKKESSASKMDLLDSPSKNLEQFIPSSNRRSLGFTGNGFHFPVSGSPHFDDSPTFLSPDSESFDSGSYCSDLGASEDIMSKSYHLYGNLDDLSRESVSDRIRRKSFFTRFNERKKPRRSSLLSKSYDTDTEWGEAKEKASRSFSINPSETCTRPSYYRSVSSGDEHNRKTLEEIRPKPFYKSHISEGSNYRKSSFELSRNPTYRRSESQSPAPYSSLTLPRNFTSVDGRRNCRSRSIYGSKSPEVERPYSPFRSCSPRPVSPSFYYEGPNNVE